MLFFYILASCITLTFVSEGRTVEGILGRNISLSWTYNNTNRDSLRITRNSSFFLFVWPLTNHIIWHEKDERIQVYVNNGTFETEHVTVSISNVTRKDAGIYKLERSWDLHDFNDSVTLQTDERTPPWITMVPHVDLYIELQCNSHNISTEKVSWSLNGSMIENNGKYTQNNSVLAIHNLTADDMYNMYKCKSSGVGFESDPYRLNICLLGPLIGVGLVIVAISLIIVGILVFLTQRCKVAFSKSGTHYQPSVESLNREVARELLRFNHGRSLTVPRTLRSGYPVVNRISGSLQTLMDHIHDIWNPSRRALSLQTLQTLTQLLYANISPVQSDDSMNATCWSKTDSMSSLNVSADRLNLDDLSSRAQRDSGVSHDEQSIRTRSVSLNNVRPHGFEQHSEEEQYSTIDEVKLPVYHCFKANKYAETLQNGFRSPEAGNNDYDIAVLPVL